MKAHGSVGSAEHYTPPWLCALVRELMGGIDLDPCSCPAAQENVQAAEYWETGALERTWKGRVFVNPPGGKARGTQKFWKKLVQE